MIFTGDGVLLLKTPYMTAGRRSKSPTAKYKKPVKVIDFNVRKNRHEIDAPYVTDSVRLSLGNLKLKSGQGMRRIP